MILYKYLTPDRIDVLQRRLIRFTQPADFNDPFEFRPAFGPLLSGATLDKTFLGKDFERGVVDALTKKGIGADVARALVAHFNPSAAARVLGERLAADPTIRGGITRAFADTMNTHAGVLCLSEVRDSALMWGHYTNCHRGIVIGFDSEHPFFSARRGPNDEFGFLRRVAYRRSRPALSLEYTDTVSVDLFQTKSEEWAYEKEWRMIRILNACTKRCESSPLPICLFEFAADAVVEIIVGMRAEASLIAQVRRIVGEFPRAALFAATEHPTEYAVSIAPLR